MSIFEKRCAPKLISNLRLGYCFVLSWAGSTQESRTKFDRRSRHVSVLVLIGWFLFVARRTYGWGAYDAESQEIPDELQQASLRVVPCQSVCVPTFGPRPPPAPAPAPVRLPCRAADPFTSPAAPRRMRGPMPTARKGG
jgi:hypothetical protein